MIAVQKVPRALQGQSREVQKGNFSGIQKSTQKDLLSQRASKLKNDYHLTFCVLEPDRVAIWMYYLLF